MWHLNLTKDFSIGLYEPTVCSLSRWIIRVLFIHKDVFILWWVRELCSIFREKKTFLVMGSLNNCGVFWAFTSLIAAFGASVGFYMPYWLRGTLRDTTVYFGVFRRCNYPHVVTGSSEATIVNECGRYATFNDIPTLSWQISTLLIGVGCGLALLVSFIAILSVCINDILSPTVARSIGTVQFCAGLLIGGGVALYPNGWDSLEVKQACGHKSNPYNLGDCKFDWSFYLTATAAGVTILWSILSCNAAKRKRSGPVSYTNIWSPRVVLRHILLAWPF